MPQQFFLFVSSLIPPLNNDFVCMKYKTMGVCKYTNQVTVEVIIFLTTIVLLCHVGPIPFHINCWTIKHASWYEFMYQLNLFLSINSCKCCWDPLANTLHLVHIITSGRSHQAGYGCLAENNFIVVITVVGKYIL